MMKEFESQSHQLMLLFSLFGLFVICLCLSDFIIAADFFNLPSDPTRLVRVVQ